MKTLTASVREGRLRLDEPTELPEGATVELVVADAGDELDDEERAALHAALDTAWASAKSGRTAPVAEILEKLKTAG